MYGADALQKSVQCGRNSVDLDHYQVVTRGFVVFLGSLFSKVSRCLGWPFSEMHLNLLRRKQVILFV